ncbi:pyrrolo-quinoline quinone, partial [Planctomycetota bacterium]
MSIKLVLITVFSFFLAVPTRGSDWPQWQGPGRDGIWPEKGIVRKFDSPQLNIRWRAKIAN